MRERIGASPEGQAALQALDEQPQDPQAVAGLHDAVRTAVAADADFAARLTSALAGPPPATAPTQVTSSVVIGGGARVNRNTISLGPVTFSNSPSGRTALTVLCVLLVALLGLAVYGGAQLITPDDSPDASPGTARQKPGAGKDGGSDSGGPGQTSEDPAKAPWASLTDAASVEQVLPDGASLPAGWTQTRAPSVERSTAKEGGGAPDFTGRVDYIPGNGGGIKFFVYAFPSVAKAHEAYTAMTPSQSSDTQPLTMPEAGDESLAYSTTRPQNTGLVDMDRTFNVTITRTGTVITVISKVDNALTLDTLTPMMSDRARRAQTG
ncbi:hypothetical protein ACFXAE_00975 [Streptomyces sp. NPDC059454]|uniref:hypothetical protein n=1 Tax=Streptomyces sp. NPDC059454 TaxID=3346836 RepID=UPI0036C96F1B